MLSELHPLNSGKTSESLLIRALLGERTTPLPVWFMRQAGRSLPEYREIRKRHAMLKSCLDPKLVHEITMQPVRRHGVDAAIFFSDIVIPLKLAGIEVDIVPSVGPVIANPVRTRERFQELGPLTAADLAPITTAVSMIVESLDRLPLIGFGGAPFTLASYLIEGGPSKNLPHSRAMMQDDPELWGDILDWCADVTAEFIRSQVLAGASALQVFDSWAGKLTREEYLRFAAPHSRRLFDKLSDLRFGATSVPRIHFGLGTEHILDVMLDAGATVLGVDYLSDLREVSARFGNRVPLQGNINPELLSQSWDALERNARAAITSADAAPGHVLNLGHGVPPNTDPEVLTRLVRLIHEVTA